MIEFQGAAALGGYARAIFSRRQRAFVVPLDFMKAQARAAARVARMRRIKEAFADYLVSEPEFDFSLDPEPVPFVERRAYWLDWVDRITIARSGHNVPGHSYGWQFRDDGSDFECEALDAAELLAAGAVRDLNREAGGVSMPVMCAFMRSGLWG